MGNLLSLPICGASTFNRAYQEGSSVVYTLAPTSTIPPDSSSGLDAQTDLNSLYYLLGILGTCCLVLCCTCLIICR